MVRPFFSSETLFTCALLCLESIVLSTAFSVLLGMLLGKFLYLGAETSLDCPRCLAFIEASLQSLGRNQDYVLRVFLHDPGAHISL